MVDGIFRGEGGNIFWTRHEGDKEFRTCFVGGLKNVGRVAKGGGAKNFKFEMEFFKVCENNLYVFLGYYRHF